MEEAANAFSDYSIRPETIQVSEGEKIRFTATNKDEGIFANRPYTVAAIGADRTITLQDSNGDQLAVHPQRLAHQHMP